MQFDVVHSAIHSADTLTLNPASYSSLLGSPSYSFNNTPKIEAIWLNIFYWLYGAIACLGSYAISRVIHTQIHQLISTTTYISPLPELFNLIEIRQSNASILVVLLGIVLYYPITAKLSYQDALKKCQELLLYTNPECETLTHQEISKKTVQAGIVVCCLAYFDYIHLNLYKKIICRIRNPEETHINTHVNIAMVNTTTNELPVYMPMLPEYKRYEGEMDGEIIASGGGERVLESSGREISEAGSSNGRVPLNEYNEGVLNRLHTGGEDHISSNQNGNNGMTHLNESGGEIRVDEVGIPTYDQLHHASV